MSPAGERPDAVVFDLDGTLVDSYRAITASLNHARSAYGLEPLPPAQVRAAVGHGLEQLIEAWVGPDRIADGVRLFRAHYAGVFASATVALPGARRALDRLHAAGVRMAVASNKPERFSTPILRALDLLERVRYVAGPDTAGRTNPDPAMLGDCLRALDVEAARALYVGDMPLDVESGRRAGLRVALVATGSAGEADLVATGQPTHRSLDALVDWIESGG